MLSILCPYNNEEILKNALEKSIQKQIDVEYELLTINAMSMVLFRQQKH